MSSVIGTTLIVLAIGCAALSAVSLLTIGFFYLVARTNGLTPDDRKWAWRAFAGFFGGIATALLLGALGSAIRSGS